MALLDGLRQRAPFLLVCALCLGLLQWTALARAEWGLELDVDLDPQRRWLSVVADLRPTATDFRFPLHRALQIAEARFEDKALAVEKLGSDDDLNWWRVRLPRQGRVQLRYHGELASLDDALDHRAVLQALAPMSSPAGSFLPAGAGWYPAPDGLFSYRLQLRLPASQRGLVPGRLAGEELPATGADAGHYQASFEFSRPSRGIDLMAGPWQVRERELVLAEGKTLRLRTYFPADLDGEPGLAEAYLDDSARYLSRYSAQIGAYPYSEFSVVASPLPTGFGMPTLTYLGEQVLRLPFIRASSLGHEVLHNWWGNGVLVDYARGNWSEGLTTFMADYAYKRELAPAQARQMRLGWLRDFAALPSGAARALVDFRARTHGAAAATGYGKAAMLFVMLEDLIGEPAFARGIRAFWEQQRFRRAGWRDLQQAFEAAAGRELDGFFRQWLEGSGAARVSAQHARFIADGGGGGGVVRVELRQHGPLHQLRLPLELDFGDRRTTHWVELDGEAAMVEVAVDRRPGKLRVDPDFRVWRHLDGAELPLILRQWMVASRPRLLVAAGDDQAMGTAGAALAAALCERKPQPISALEDGDEAGMQMLVGSAAAVSAVLEASGAEVPAELPAAHGASARVWTQRLPAGAPLLVVAASDAAAVEALLRPLPHYGAQSWLLFDHGRARSRGAWTAGAPAIEIETR